MEIDRVDDGMDFSKWHITGGYGNPKSPNYKGGGRWLDPQMPTVKNPFAVLNKLIQDTQKSFEDRRIPFPTVQRIIVNKSVMIVIWDDGTKNRATCSEADQFDLEIGFGMCLVKKLYGKKRLAKMLKRAIVIKPKEELWPQ
jgi:hypothetical protein